MSAPRALELADSPVTPAQGYSVAEPAAPVAQQGYLAGDVVAGKYKLVRVLGEGGMGSVWLARNAALDVDVALKLIKRDLAALDASERLLQEARAAARLGHPSIVRIFDFGQTEKGDPFIVMEVLEGESLGDLLARRGRLPALHAVRMLLPVASALGAAHAKGIVHRDMKPDNVVLVPADGGGILPKVVDFGIAKLRRDDVDRQITQAGLALGTPDYMSPEQARGKSDLDQRIDVWALTVMLYEAITGRRPFDGANYNALMTAVMLEDPTPATEFAAGDEELWTVLRKGLAKEKADRWPSMRAFGAALAEWAIERGAHDDIAGNSLRAHWLSEAREAPAPKSGDHAAAIDHRLSLSDFTPPAARRLSTPSRPGAAQPFDAPPSSKRGASTQGALAPPDPAPGGSPSKSSGLSSRPSISGGLASDPSMPEAPKPTLVSRRRIVTAAGLALVLAGVVGYAMLRSGPAPTATAAPSAALPSPSPAAPSLLSAAPAIAPPEAPAAEGPTTSVAAPAIAPPAAANTKPNDKRALPARSAAPAATAAPTGAPAKPALPVPDNPNF